MSARVVLICFLFLFAPLRAIANAAPNVVTDWATIVQGVIHNAAAPRSGGTSQILHAMVMLAVYDAVVAIEGGYEPFGTAIDAAAGADVRAAVATAAYRTAHARILASQKPLLDTQYAAYLATIPNGFAKSSGIQIGEAAAASILAMREDDGFFNIVLYECSSMPAPVGEFVPDAGCPTAPGAPQPVDAKVGKIKSFIGKDAARVRPSGPTPLTSAEYAADFAETRDYGRMDSTRRSDEQRDIAYFWSENPYVHWNRNLTSLAIAKNLTILEAARFFAMVHTTVAEAIIAGFEAKYYYAAWRPRTAIPLADLDGNPDTDADPTWRPLLMVNHPEYPSGHGFWTTALVEAVAAFFETNKMEWTITTSKAAVPALVKTERTYDHLNKLAREVGNARVWGGLHWRTSINHGEQIGRKVAAEVTRGYFRKVE